MLVFSSHHACFHIYNILIVFLSIASTMTYAFFAVHRHDVEEVLGDTDGEDNEFEEIDDHSLFTDL